MSKRSKIVRHISFFEYKKQFFTSWTLKVFIDYTYRFQINMYFCHPPVMKRNYNEL